MPVNVERIIDQADRVLTRKEASHVRRLREVSNRTYESLAREVRRAWPTALSEAQAAGSRTFAEARARALLAQLESLLQALDYGRPSSGVPPLVRDMIIAGQETGLAVANELLTAYDTTLPAAATARIDVRAVDAAVANSQARLTRYGLQARQEIEQAIVDGLVRGEGSQKVTRRVREALRGDGRTPAAGLHARAETIARTELTTAKAEASRERYREVGVEYGQWFATQDERTCPYCGHRHGKVYELDEVQVPAHPRCRCYVAPFRREWADDPDLVDRDAWQAEEREIAKLVPDQKRGATPFERANGRPAARAVWTPSSGWVG